jgi:uncharacterized membrane protein YkvA (DUF1232 family)
MEKFLKNIGVFLIGGIALIYLINPTAGIIEIIPDNLPLVGNLDEAAATAILLSAFNYYGINLMRFFGIKENGENK